MTTELSTVVVSGGDGAVAVGFRVPPVPQAPANAVFLEFRAGNWSSHNASLGVAVQAWLERGMGGGCALKAMAERYSREDGSTILETEYDPRTGSWSEWVPEF